jgi:hypothetical protein
MHSHDEEAKDDKKDVLVRLRHAGCGGTVENDRHARAGWAPGRAGFTHAMKKPKRMKKMCLSDGGPSVGIHGTRCEPRSFGSGAVILSVSQTNLQSTLSGSWVGGGGSVYVHGRVVSNLVCCAWFVPSVAWRMFQHGGGELVERS